ncbi:MAG: hypothetical protein WC867_00835 [Candidatus Pacearchaeota archaeon]|jgi:hypothetical protein
MDSNLQEIVNSILSHTPGDTIPDDLIRKGLDVFADSYRKLIPGEDGICYDKAAFTFISTIVGDKNLAVIQLYMDYYETNKIVKRKSE